MPAGSTYSTIATTTLTSNQSSVVFSSIGSYTDIICVFNGTAQNEVSIGFQFNSDSGNNYSYTRIYGDGTSAASDRITNTNACYFGIIGTAQSTAIGHIMNYVNSNTNKTVIGRGNTGLYVSGYVSMWRNTNAITSLTLVPGSGNFVTGSTLTIYGIAASG
jgi:hypothetical protein